MEFSCVQTENISCSNRRMRNILNGITYAPKFYNEHLSACDEELIDKDTQKCIICSIIHVITCFHGKHGDQRNNMPDKKNELEDGCSCALMVKTPCLENVDDCHQSTCNKIENGNTMEPVDEEEDDVDVDVEEGDGDGDGEEGDDNKICAEDKNNAETVDSVEKKDIDNNMIERDNDETLVNKKADGNEMEQKDKYNGNTIVTKEGSEKNIATILEDNAEEDDAKVDVVGNDKLLMERDNSDAVGIQDVVGILQDIANDISSCNNDLISQDISEPSHEQSKEQSEDKVLPRKGKGNLSPILLTMSELFKSHCINSFESSDTFRNTLKRILDFWFGNVATLKSTLRRMQSKNPKEFPGVYEWVLLSSSPDSMTVVVIPICRLDDLKLLFHQSYGFMYNKNDDTFSVYIHKSFNDNTPTISMPSSSSLDWITGLLSIIKNNATIEHFPPLSERSEIYRKRTVLSEDPGFVPRKRNRRGKRNRWIYRR